MTKQELYDAIIIGSGATGGWAAKELTEGGMRVLVLEAGGHIFWQLLHQKLLAKLRSGNTSNTNNQQMLRLIERQPIQSKCYAWKASPNLFVDDIDNPYTTPKDKPFVWFRSRQVGGRMVVKLHGRRLFRFSDYEFKAASRDGYGEDWPISYADLMPYYEKVERYMGIRGIAENKPNLPDSIFLPGMKMTATEQLLKLALDGHRKDYQVVVCPTASPPTTLSAAMRTGRLKLRPNAVVSHIIVDRDTSKAKGVAFVDQTTHKSYEVFSKVIVLCASTIESTRILLNSATQQHPTGLGNSSGVLGHYLMDHTKIGIEGIIPNPERFIGNLPTNSPQSGSVYIPQFRNITQIHPKFIRGYGTQVTLLNEMLLKEKATAFRMRAFGEMLPRFENHVKLNKDKKDAWGIPIVDIECMHSDNEYEMARDQIESLKEIAFTAGFKVLHEDSEMSSPGTANHEVGTARMGNDPKKSVLNQFNQSWDVKNLFITDGACFVSQGYQNPTLTMMAITVRACEYILHQYKRNNL